jgi:hypothetical protein
MRRRIGSKLGSNRPCASGFSWIVAFLTSSISCSLSAGGVDARLSFRRCVLRCLAFLFGQSFDQT